MNWVGGPHEARAIEQRGVRPVDLRSSAPHAFGPFSSCITPWCEVIATAASAGVPLQMYACHPDGQPGLITGAGSIAGGQPGAARRSTE